MESATPDGPAGPTPRRRRRPPLRRWHTRFRSTLRRLNRIVTWARRALAAVEQSHYRRFLISFVAGIAVLAAMRVEAINQSIFGQPDRQMMDSAFQIRTDQETGGDPALFIDIDDSTIAGIRSANGPTRAPAATAPRGILADVLEYIRTAPPNKGAQTVVVDVDLATPTPGDEAGAAKLHKVLADWAQTPSAPPLILARQSFPEAVLGGQGDGLVLPTTDYDDVVTPAPNI